MTTTDWAFPRADSLPTYAFLVTDEVKARTIAAGAEIIDLGLGNPDRPTPKPIVERLHEAADIGKNHRYHPGRGYPELRKALSRWYSRRYSVSFDPDRDMLVTMGAKEGISHLCLAILDRGDVAVVPDPCYPIHRGAPLIAGAEPVSYPAQPGLSPAEAVGQTLTRLRREGRHPKLVIANYPQNPTGQVVTRAELAALVRLVADSGALLLHDLAYADLDFSARHAPSIFDCGIDPEEVRKFAVEVFSMSKSYSMPGWRIAYMVGNERMVSALAKLKTYMDYGTFIPLQVAAAWALDHGDALADELRALYETRATALVNGLRAAGWGEVAEPSGTMFVWTKLPAAWRGMTSLEAATRLIERAHVGVAPGSGFGPGGEGYVRFALIEDPPRIAEACERIRRELARG
ncbi:MAG: aminotransferase class I/II-fold pyridoxal phosphate-dependent enzyme [Sorangiineae bacterium]|nr:aminotransferase class I/II-fold pyridoxal phosphate-dependent enzyme [Polyangiaceae bacterium]MEB2325175.1 aminotransferase class I/II-fold pyridoxal phosphate-dependent enzyme [Sorangiineae bacterium]